MIYCQKMKKIFEKLSKPTKIILSLALVLLGIALLVFSQIKPYTLVVNGNHIQMRALAFTPRKLLELAEIEVVNEDRVSTELDRMTLSIPEIIVIDQARNVLIKTLEGEKLLFSPGLYPANLLQEAEIKLYPQDLMLINEDPIDPNQSLPAGQDLVLELLPAKQLDLVIDGVHQTTLFTQALTLKEALDESDITFHEKDTLSLPLDTFLDSSNTLDVTKARQICVTTTEDQFCGMTSHQTVASALADLGLSPQILDYAQPSETQALPDDGHISLVRVEERLLFEKEETSFAFSYAEDPDGLLDTTSTLQSGQPGIRVARTTERFENGQLISTESEPAWKASDARDGIMGYGTKVVVQTETVDGQSIEYWRKLSVYATSYHPAEFDGSAITRSGVPLTKGVVAVSAAWYPSMASLPVYVPGYGYGTIADSGYGIPGTRWIDLGYDDENYVGWHHWTTIYFLTPIPSNIMAVLP